MEYVANVGVYDYERNKLCDLYDSEVNLTGQAFGIEHTQNSDGIGLLTFNIPYMVDQKTNFRWKYLKSEYLIRLYYNGKVEWFVANKPVKKKSGREVIGSVSCNGTPILLKTKNIYMEFDDENGIGTYGYLLDQILAGTGWHVDYNQSDIIYEEDGVTEKVRSLNSTGSKGSLGLLNDVCKLFMCRPVYYTDTKTIVIKAMKNRDMLFEAEVGKNLDALSVNYNSDDIITRLYVEGEYGDYGYIGIDDVNPTGLTYIFDFDYYREIGLFSETHEEAYRTYLSDIRDVNRKLKANQNSLNQWEDKMNELVGQCNLTVYYRSNGFVTPTYVHGSPTDEEKALTVGDEVVVLNEDGTHRYETILTSPQALLHNDDYAIAKFGTKAAGTVGAKEVQIEAKEKQIDNLNRKINATTKEDKKAEYQLEIAQLQEEIDTIYGVGDPSADQCLYRLMSDIMKQDGILNAIHGLETTRNILLDQQDEIEATFIIAMGDMLRDGKWQNNNYIGGQEAHLFADAKEVIKVLSRPDASYTFDYVRMHTEYGVPLEDIKINAIVHVIDDDLEVNANLYVSKIVTGIDKRNFGTIEVSSDDLNLSSNDLSSLLSRMSQLADLIEQKNQIYERAEAISKSGTFFADRLNGMIEVTKNQILSSVSNWWTDENGNIVFESVDGGSAMMLSGAGFMLADRKTDDGEWEWRTTGTGHGFTADEIVAGFLSADRIEAGSIEVTKVAPNFGTNLTITNNPSITNINAQIELLPDRIHTIVQDMNISKTFVQTTDPALDPENNVRDGDYWIVANEDDDVGAVTWNYLNNDKKWNDLRVTTWGALGGYTKMYCRNKGKWVMIYDRSIEPIIFTQITQTSEKIEMEAVRAMGTEEQLRGSLTVTAEAIDAEVTRATTAEGTLSGRITTNATSITAEVTRAKGAEGDLSASIKINADAISAEVKRATKQEGTLTSSIEANTKSISAEITRAKNAETGITAKLSLDSNGRIRLTSTNFSSLGSSSSGIYITPTSMRINSGGTVNINSGGKMTISSGASLTIASASTVTGAMTIKSGGSMTIGSGTSMSINSGGSLTIKSGGKFSLTSTYFKVTDTGQITATGGTIGGFTIGADKLSAGTGSSYIQMATSGWAFAAGNTDVSEAPFRVSPTGDVYIKSLMVRNADDTGWDKIDFTSFATQEDVSGGFSKLKYNTVVSVNTSASTMTLSNGKTYPIG